MQHLKVKEGRKKKSQSVFSDGKVANEQWWVEDSKAWRILIFNLKMVHPKKAAITKRVMKQESHESTLPPEKGIRLRCVWVEGVFFFFFSSTPTEAEKTTAVTTV